MAQHANGCYQDRVRCQAPGRENEGQLSNLSLNEGIRISKGRTPREGKEDLKGKSALRRESRPLNKGTSKRKSCSWDKGTWRKNQHLKDKGLRGANHALEVRSTSSRIRASKDGGTSRRKSGPQRMEAPRGGNQNLVGNSTSRRELGSQRQM